MNRRSMRLLGAFAVAVALVFLVAPVGAQSGKPAAAKPPAGEVEPRKWVTLEELEAFPLPRPHLKIVELLRSGTRRT